MLWGGDIGSLQLRRQGDGSVKFHGTFPYNRPAVLSDGGRNGGRPLKEVIRPRAFAYTIEDPDRDVLFLYGHDIGMPMASQSAGTLVFRDSEGALTFDAILTPEVQQTSWVRDFLASYAAGLVYGLSPGFRIPPQQTVPDAVEQEEEDPSEGRAVIRYINEAILLEMSVVTKGAYPDAQVEARNWTPEPEWVPRKTIQPLNRWRL